MKKVKFSSLKNGDKFQLFGGVDGMKSIVPGLICNAIVRDKGEVWFHPKAKVRVDS